ncbi:MAG: UbiH/UbiF/VisC/COQ6 family ubiquinone biosynthesis hydroxylase [Alphaproteobacteria bacterium]|nr:UbiH/UbiF/VisC/COQ6 family ubiquinone biosynthesis hydroxylase [Alphaproteobacteria bacterium]
MTDIIIVGGGLTGGTLACALAEKGLQVAVVDQVGPHSPTPTDGRSFALSRSSFHILSKLGIWETLDDVTPITKIHTSDGVLPQWVEFNEMDVTGGPLGYVVDSALLKAKILEKVFSFKNITLHAPQSVLRMERTDFHAFIETNGGETLKAPLCIAADGRFSHLRTEAQIPLIKWSYDQVAIVCHLTHTLPHNNQAFEHFLPWGPLAFVPRPGNESGLVWSVEKEKADVFLALSPEDFAAEIQAHFGDCLGQFTLSSKRWSYALSVCLPKRLIDTRLALVGDAAHTFHPVAGQGLNVGFRDVSVLADVLTEAFSLGLDLGASQVLKTYQKRRRGDIIAMTLLTDGMVRVFSNQSRVLARVRSVGFGVVKYVTPLRHMMIRHAMGMRGHAPFLWARERSTFQPTPKPISKNNPKGATHKKSV